MIKLQVPFTEKDKAKSLGARWLAAERCWVIPPGADKSLFAAWLPEQSEAETASETITASNQVSLSSYLEHITGIITASCMQYVWLTAEISECREHNGHLYLTLVEHNAQNARIAKCSAMIWQSSFAQIKSQFEQVMGGPLQVGQQVLLQARAKMHANYGLSLDVIAVDPSYTLGAMAKKLALIRKQLITENIFALNKKLLTPQDFYRVGVISPDHAAGLGDFQQEADLLSAANLVKFEYVAALFQGDKAATSILQALHKLLAQADLDCIVIIRGGGATSDLAWLNDYGLAKAVCCAALPILVGIGHQRDQTILDEVANRSFATPSKVSNFIVTTIVSRVQQQIDFMQFICMQSDRIIANLQSKLQECWEIVLHKSKSFCQVEELHLHKLYTILVTQSNNLLDKYQDRLIAGKELLEQASTSFVQLQQQQIEYSYVNVKQQWQPLIQNILQQMQYYYTSVCQLGPQAILAKGYAIVTSKDKFVTTARQAQEQEHLVVQFIDGKVSVLINKESHE